MSQRLRILTACHFLPRPDQASGDRRYFAMLEMLAREHQVDLVATERFEDRPRYVRMYEQIGVRVLPLSCWGVACAAMQHRYDLALLEYYYEASTWTQALRRAQPWCRVIVDSVDVHYLRVESGLAFGAYDASGLAEARQAELEAYRQADAVIVVSEGDRAALAAEPDMPPLFLVPNVVPLRERPAGPREAKLLFVGGYGHAPNVDAVIWFVTSVWPAVRAAVPEAQLTLAGAKATQQVVDLGRHPGVEVVGFVPQTEPYLDSAAVVIAPLRFGAGMKGKVCEALASAAPVVTTRIGAQGLDLVNEHHALIADEAVDFAQAVIRLLRDPELAERLGRAGRDQLARICGPEVVQRRLFEAVERVGTGENNWPQRLRWRAGSVIFTARETLKRALAPTGIVQAVRRRRPPPAAAAAAVVAAPSGPPAVSVILPVCNAAPYLDDAVRSILTQRFGDYELILIDDGSTDGSLEILHHHARADRRVRLVSRENRGLVRTLNEGLSLARGRYVARMDADDIALPHRFERQVAGLEADPALVCLGANYELMDAAGRKLTTLSLPTDDQQIQARLLEGHSSICHPLAMMRREALERIGGYDESFPHAEDLDLWLRLGEIGRLGNLPEVLLRYRLHEQALSEAAGAQQHHWSRIACEKAWKRRGVQGAFGRTEHHRPSGDPDSRYAACVRYGWWAFGSRERRTAIIYGVKAVRRRPYRGPGWKLLLASLFKRIPGPAAATRPLPPAKAASPMTRFADTTDT